MTDPIAKALHAHLLRHDGQEDVCLATYRPSTGAERRTALVHEVLQPRPGERSVHGNASFTGDYVVRAASTAARNGDGVVILHSHPSGRGWQRMSSYDADAEASYAYLVNEITGYPLLGMTLAGSDHTWSARSWDATAKPMWCESVRVVGERLAISWNDELRPPPSVQPTQLRTVSGWGERIQADIARMRVLVVGAGSVGLEVGLRLVASGIEHVAVMDYDTIEIVNLDRLIGATMLDALLYRAKTDVAHRLLNQAATAERPKIATHELSICEPAGHDIALDYDVIFSCVDRPWPRAVLNMLAYTDLIPVIDGGIHIDPFPDHGLRNATWRSHVIRPGRPCLACNKQLDLGAVPLDRDGLLDDPAYIAKARPEARPARQNVALLSVSVAASLLAQFVSLVSAPGGFGEPGPLRYSLSTHTLEHLTHKTKPNCCFEQATNNGNNRLSLTGPHAAAEDARRRRLNASKRPHVRLGRAADNTLTAARDMLMQGIRRRERRAL